MSKCYKCGATEELSKRGKTVMICKPCRRAQYYKYKGIDPPVQRPVRVELPRKIIHKCYKCKTIENIEANKSRISSKRYECFKCSVRLTHNLSLPRQVATPEWMARAKASHQLILERRT